MEDIYIAKASMMIRKDPKKVFDAFTQAEITTQFWFTHASGSLTKGQSVQWRWSMYNHEIEVFVTELIPNELLIIEWGDISKSKVVWSFKKLSEDKTFVSIENSGFTGTDEEKLAKVIDATSGFTIVLNGAKAYLEHNINLNLIADKYPPELMQ